jgi:predicted ATPase
MLAARIDRLPAAAKQLLQISAVIGHEVPFSLLQAVVERPAETLGQNLAHLQRAEFLYERGLFSERTYTFKHALTHEVAYGSLLQEQRRALHARIVEAIEAVYADHLAEHIERLAHHALRGEVWDKAMVYCRQAGVKAGARSAYREAGVCFDRALEAVKHLPESQPTLEQAIDLRCELRTALIPLGEIRRVHDLLLEAEILAKAVDDQRRLGHISGRLCHTYCRWATMS